MGGISGPGGLSSPRPGTVPQDRDEGLPGSCCRVPDTGGPDHDALDRYLSSVSNFTAGKAHCGDPQLCWESSTSFLARTWGVPGTALMDGSAPSVR